MKRPSITWQRFCVMSLLVWTWNALLPSASADEPPYPLDAPIIFTQLPVDAEAETWLEAASNDPFGAIQRNYGNGGRIVRLDPNGKVRMLTEAFEDACGCDVSFDGKRILFAARRWREDSWSIWEMDAEGGNIRQITRDCGNCRSPAYQATLYTIVSTEPWYQIMFASDMAGELSDIPYRSAHSLYSCKMDGSAIRRLTLNLSDDWDPFLMRDGRVLLSSWQRRDMRRSHGGRVALFSVNTDGADYALYAGDQGKRYKLMPCETTDGLVVFVEASCFTWDGAGQLAAVKTRRPLYSHRSLTNDPDYRFHSPSPLPDGSILVSVRPRRRPPSRAKRSPTPTDLRKQNHGLYRFDLETGERRLVFDDPEYHDIHARLVAPRPQPDGRSSVVNEKYPTGRLYCLNSYLTDPKYIGDMKKETIRSVRVLEGVPLKASDFPDQRPETQSWCEAYDLRSVIETGRPLAQRRILGIVPVEEDGSFNIEVPADVPIELQTLDENGMALRSCGWIWVKHREPRGCIGCHEDPELTPENKFVMAVRKPSIQLTLSPEKRRTVDFRRDVMPILTGKCAGCHNGTHGEFDFTAADSPDDRSAYKSLLVSRGCNPARDENRRSWFQYAKPGAARSSQLIWRLVGQNTSRPWDETYNPGQKITKHPPSDAPQLTKDELLTIIEWIDMGALWDGIPGPDELDEESDSTGAGK